jgi:uncharacterized membrane protein YhaH (DUF805 family)
MRRYDRSRFIAFGVLPALNVVALLLYGLALATGSGRGSEQAVPALIAMAAVCLLTAMWAAIKRGRDLGWPWWATLLGFWLSVGLGPVVLLLVGYLALAKSNPSPQQRQDPPPRADAATWFWAAMNLGWPWLALAVLAKVM